jgi:hypothetical protein
MINPWYPHMTKEGCKLDEVFICATKDKETAVKLFGQQMFPENVISR